MYLNSDLPFSKTIPFNLFFSVEERFLVWIQKPIKKPNLFIPIFSNLVALFISIPKSFFKIVKQYFSARLLSPLNFKLIWLLIYSLITLGFTGNGSLLKLTAKLELVNFFKVSMLVL